MLLEHHRLHESEREYRFKDNGPKYLMKGPNLNFAIVQFTPGSDFRAHYHEVMEEDFYILEGKINIVVDGMLHRLEKGDFIHVAPNEVHYLYNPYDTICKMVSVLGPHQEIDKIELTDYLWDKTLK